MQMTSTPEQQKTEAPAPRAFVADNLPSLDRLDQLTYQIIAFGFPLLTLTIITGAIWAKATWATWWSWDPKETASLVAWLVYAAYLHGRIQRGWHGAPAATFALLGFLSIMFCYAGVNFLPSLHSYGSPVAREGGRLMLGGFHGIGGAEVLLTKGFIVAFILSMLAYIVFTVSRNAAWGKAGTVFAWIGFVGLTSVIGLRTYEMGRLPLTSGYDFSLCFVWGVTGSYLVSERLLRARALGTFVMPIVLLLTMYAYLLFPMKAGTPLMPALQNKFWLHFHVAVAILAYGALALSCATAVMYFVKRRLVASPSRKAREVPADEETEDVE